MNSKLPEKTNPAEVSEINGVDAAVSAMGAAMANREAILKSFAERRDQVFKLLDAQREEALKPMLHAKELLQQAHATAGVAGHPGQAAIQHDVNNSCEGKTADSRQHLCRTFSNGFMVLLALQGAGGGAADAARDQAVSAIVDALVELVEAEVDKLLDC
jgi:hypothetical protein